MRYAAIALSVLLVAGCGSKDAPSGQVLVNVDGIEITQSELNAELAGRRGANAQEQKQLEMAVLNQMIARTMLAKTARDQGLDKTPEAAIARRRAEDAVLIQLLERKLGSEAPKISADEITNFVSDNVDTFASRRIYVVDQVIVASPTPDLLAALKDVRTMDQAKAELAKRNLASTGAVGTIDALTVPPVMAKQIAALPPEEVFIVPSEGAIRINHIRDSQLSPVTGEDAARVARGMLMQQRGGQQVQDAIKKILSDGRSKVQFNPAFAPPASGKPATGKAQ